MPDRVMAVLLDKGSQIVDWFGHQMLCDIVLLKSTMHKAE
jgi:hypothetical protein